jgi:PKD repeat protein
MAIIQGITWGIGILCFLLLIHTVSAAVPVASFFLVLNDTSTNTPTSWQWNATNLIGNNTPFTFSTAQHPPVILPIGNWFIQLIASNSAGSNTSTTKTLGLNLTGTVIYYWDRIS